MILDDQQFLLADPAYESRMRNERDSTGHIFDALHFHRGQIRQGFPNLLRLFRAGLALLRQLNGLVRTRGGGDGRSDASQFRCQAGVRGVETNVVVGVLVGCQFVEDHNFLAIAEDERLIVALIG